MDTRDGRRDRSIVSGTEAGAEPVSPGGVVPGAVQPSGARWFPGRQNPGSTGRQICPETAARIKPQAQSSKLKRIPKNQFSRRSPSSAVAKTSNLIANNLRILDPDFLHYIFNQF